MTPTERVAMIVYLFGHGAELTSAHVAQITGLQTSSARRLLNNLSRVIPIYDDENHVWRMLGAQDARGCE